VGWPRVEVKLQLRPRKSLTCRVSSVVEQRFCKPLVAGSNPAPGTKRTKHISAKISSAYASDSKAGVTIRVTRRVRFSGGSLLLNRRRDTVGEANPPSWHRASIGLTSHAAWQASHLGRIGAALSNVPSASAAASLSDMPFALPKSYPDVMVVQPRQDWDGYNDPGPLDCPT
jgi:hypothetical protein